MHTAYCHHCRKGTNLKESIALQIPAGHGEENGGFVLKSYHCEGCSLFLWSEEEKGSGWKWIGLHDFLRMVSRSHLLYKGKIRIKLWGRS